MVMQHKIPTRYDCNFAIGLGASIAIVFLVIMVATLLGNTDKDGLPFAATLVVCGLAMAMGLLIWRVAFLVRPPRL